MPEMRANAAKKTGDIWFNLIFSQYPVNDLIDERVVYMVDMRKKVMGNMVVEPSKYKIGHFAKGIKIIGASYLVIYPVSADVASFIYFEISCFFNVMSNKKCK